MGDMKLIMEGWRHFHEQQEDQGDRIADILTRLNDLEGRQTIEVGDIKFLVALLARQIASGGKLLQQLQKGAAAAGVEVAADAMGLGILKSAGSLVAGLGKRAKIKVKSDAEVMASLMLIDDAAATKNPILDLLNVHDAYEGALNPLLNGPFVEYAWEELQKESDTHRLDTDWGTETMKKFLKDTQSLQTEPTR